ncbi:T9SS type A sorting domain-containing protein [Paracrocinitomix mangrovi]|uniref:GEVED domain-containing protein n=1 Tax=Paracrocinitomix mangrovi TaxID=2862509 RepID=UPI001C8ED74A|nr:GEVED domain-containing protein [Paracrocinitomix mangrovi]UKN02432.1 T9SS type A sorting domain-containing protein [Paracrocinitomix mangrovi]
MGRFTLLILLLFATYSHGQYCTSVGPSSTADSNLKILNLSGENGTSINFIGCPGVLGLDDQTANQTVDLTPGNPYSASIEFGTCGGNYGNVATAWIDFNQNGIFETGEILGTWTGTPPSNQVFNFSVPSGAVSGTTRLRVVQRESGSLPLDPCGTYTWGSTTDFTVVIGTSAGCVGYIGDNIMDPRLVTSLPFQETHSNQICYSNNVPVYNSPDVFYRIIVSDFSAENINVSLCGSTFDTYLQVWDKDSSVIASNDDYVPCGSSSEITFNTSDLDTVYIIVQGYANLSGDYDITINDGEVAGIEENFTEFNVFPNPTNGLVKIQGSNVDAIEIYDTKGKLVLQQNININTEIDLNELSPGLYLVKPKGINNSVIQKIILKP